MNVIVCLLFSNIISETCFLKYCHLSKTLVPCWRQKVSIDRYQIQSDEFEAFTWKSTKITSLTHQNTKQKARKISISRSCCYSTRYKYLLWWKTRWNFCKLLSHWPSSKLELGNLRESECGNGSFIWYCHVVDTIFHWFDGISVVTCRITWW